MPIDFYLFICRTEHITALNKILLKDQTVAEIILKFVEKGQLLQLKQFLNKMHLFISLSIQHYFKNIFVEWMTKLLRVNVVLSWLLPVTKHKKMAITLI